jgi:hypothetical protein
MAVSESDRHELYRSLERTIGKRPAETFMTIISQVPWAEVATRQDLAGLEQGLMQAVADLRVEMHKAMRTQLLAIVTVFTLLNGMLLAAIKLL